MKMHREFTEWLQGREWQAMGRSPPGNEPDQIGLWGNGIYEKLTYFVT
jgi:hypothetical protein